MVPYILMTKNKLQAVKAIHIVAGEYSSVTAATALVVALLLFIALILPKGIIFRILKGIVRVLTSKIHRQFPCRLPEFLISLCSLT